MFEFVPAVACMGVCLCVDALRALGGLACSALWGRAAEKINAYLCGRASVFVCVLARAPVNERAPRGYENEC